MTHVGRFHCETTTCVKLLLNYLRLKCVHIMHLQWLRASLEQRLFGRHVDPH